MESVEFLLISYNYMHFFLHIKLPIVELMIDFINLQVKNG